MIIDPLRYRVPRLVKGREVARSLYEGAVKAGRTDEYVFYYEDAEPGLPPSAIPYSSALAWGRIFVDSRLRDWCRFIAECNGSPDGVFGNAPNGCFRVIAAMNKLYAAALPATQSANIKQLPEGFYPFFDWSVSAELVKSETVANADPNYFEDPLTKNKQPTIGTPSNPGAVPRRATRPNYSGAGEGLPTVAVATGVGGLLLGAILMFKGVNK